MTEVEYVAAAEVCLELRWVKSLLEEMSLLYQIKWSICSKVHVDNQSAISLIKNHDIYKSSKHVTLKNNFCRKQYKKGLIKVAHIPNKRQLAEFLIKAKSLITI